MLPSPTAKGAQLVPSPWKATKTVLQVTLSAAPSLLLPRISFTQTCPRGLLRGQQSWEGVSFICQLGHRCSGSSGGSRGRIWVRTGSEILVPFSSLRHVPTAERACVGICCPWDLPPRLLPAPLRMPPMPPAHLTPWGSFYLEAPPPALSAHLKAPFGHHLLCESRTGPLTGLQAVRCPLSCPHTMPPVTCGHGCHIVLPLTGSPAGLGTHPEPGTGLQSQQLNLAVLGAPGCQVPSHVEGGLPRGAGVRERVLGAASTAGDTSRRPNALLRWEKGPAQARERAAPRGPRGAALPG